MATRATYHYDALDRLAARSDPVQGAGRYFYCEEQRSTETRNGQHRRFLRSDRHLLARQESLAGSLRTLLLLTDRADSVLAVAGAPSDLTRYTPYGHHVPADILAEVPGFNGEHPDPLTGHYPLGNGYRSYNPVLMRFNSPDSLSPFSEGGMNAYAYCMGDPVNRRDLDGHESERIASFIWIGIGLAGAFLGLATAMPALTAVWKGTATHIQKLTAISAVGTTAASGVFTASRVTAAVRPDSKASEAMLWGAVALGLPMLGLRVGLYVNALPRVQLWKTQKSRRLEIAIRSVPVRKSILNRGLEASRANSGSIRQQPTPASPTRADPTSPARRSQSARGFSQG